MAHTKPKGSMTLVAKRGTWHSTPRGFGRMTYRLRIMREELGSADERHKLARKRPRTPHALDEVRLRELERADHRGGAGGAALRPVLPQQPNELCYSATVRGRWAAAPPCVPHARATCARVPHARATCACDKLLVGSSCERPEPVPTPAGRHERRVAGT
jgi:hypothetical protein